MSIKEDFENSEMEIGHTWWNSSLCRVFISKEENEPLVLNNLYVGLFDFRKLKLVVISF